MSKPESNRVFPFFELGLVVALCLIGSVAYLLYEIEPQVADKNLKALRDQYLALADSVKTNVPAIELLVADASTWRDTQSAENQFNVATRPWIQWLARESSRMHHLQGEKTGDDQSAESGGTTNVLTRSQLDQALLLDRIRRNATEFVSAERFLMLNQAMNFGIKAQIAAQQDASNRAKKNLRNLGQQARMHGDNLSVMIAGNHGKLSDLQTQVRYVRLILLLAFVVICLVILRIIYRRKLTQTGSLIEEHRRQYEEQQLTMEKLAHFGRLAAEVAHEVKQPLTAMNARAYTLQKAIPDGTEAHEDTVVIRSEIKRLDQIVKGFLALARPAEPSLVPMGANEALGEICNIMAPQLAQQSTQFNFDCEPGLQISADFSQLKQVLINLIKNAAESVGHDGAVTLRAKADVRELGGRESDTTIIEVEDTGPGIPPEVQNRIFEPFFSTKGSGTGLGLAIAARIVDKHGGKLEFDPSQPKKTVFRVVLPACTNGEPQEQNRD